MSEATAGTRYSVRIFLAGIRYSLGARGIVRSLAIERINESACREATQIFYALFQYGFFALSYDQRQRNLGDPGYHCTPLFLEYTELMEYFGIGEV